MSQLPLRIGLSDPPTFANFHDAKPSEALQILRSHVRGDSAGPLVYLLGPTGSGKTHLLAATLHAASERGDRAVGLSPSEPGQASPELLEGLGETGVVVIDDVETGLGVSEWEVALFHLYRRGEASGAKLVVASRLGPQALEVALPDLASRLRGALVVRLPVLNEQGQRAVLSARASARGFELGADVLEYLLRRARRDMHTLMRYLERLDAASLAEKRRITVPLMRDVLSDSVCTEQEG